MEFIRKRTGSKTRKEWRDTEKLGYRITWRNEAEGVALIPAYYASVQVETPDGRLWWDFAQHRRTYKTRNKAIEACERNQKVWSMFIDLGNASGRRSDRLDALNAKGKVGGGNVLSSVPAWAKPLCDPTLLRMQFPVGKRQRDDDEDDECDPSDLTKTSPSSETVGMISSSSTGPASNGHASTAGDASGSSPPAPSQMSSKATSSATESSATPAEAPAKARAKRSSKPTAKSSTAGSEEPKPTTKRKPSAKSPSPNSPKKRS